MKTTGNEHAAQRAGYPAMIFGLTPNDRAYWTEPGLPWASEYLNTHPGPKPATWQAVQLDTDVMAPRFPAGCSVIAEPVPQGAPLLPGVYIWQTPHAPGTLAIGRLPYAATPTDNALFLDLDNRKAGIICLLEWAHPAFALYRVTHYNALSEQQSDSLPTPTH